MNFFRVIPMLLFLMALPFSAVADWIVLNGMTYKDVYVREGRSSYFVHFPETGEVMNVPRAGVQDSDVGILKDGPRREALLAKWRKANPERQRDVLHRRDVRRQAAMAATMPPVPTFPAQAGQASGRMETRRYELGETTLPKIVLRSPSVLMAAPAMRSAASYGPARVPRRGMGNRGMGMAMPGYGMPGMGGVGIRGGGFQRDVTAITNISDLFSTIHDPLVGESLPEIMPAYLFLRRR